MQRTFRDESRKNLLLMYKLDEILAEELLSLEGNMEMIGDAMENLTTALNDITEQMDMLTDTVDLVNDEVVKLSASISNHIADSEL